MTIEPTDFKVLIADLVAHGTSIYKISLMMHREYIQIDRWAKGIGRGPLHYEGEMLKAIYEDTFHGKPNNVLVTERQS